MGCTSVDSTNSKSTHFRKRLNSCSFKLSYIFFFYKGTYMKHSHKNLPSLSLQWSAVFKLVCLHTIKLFCGEWEAASLWPLFIWIVYYLWFVEPAIQVFFCVSWFRTCSHLELHSAVRSCAIHMGSGCSAILVHSFEFVDCMVLLYHMITCRQIHCICGLLLGCC